jgi:hypothetical protein
MGEEFKVDPAALRTAAKTLHESAGEVESHGKTLGAKTGGRSIAKGGFAFIEAEVKRGIKIVEHDITHAVKKFLKGDAAGLEKAAAETDACFGANGPLVPVEMAPLFRSFGPPSGGG